jgi:cbb3-type cytochrome oxidase subunit 3
METQENSILQPLEITTKESENSPETKTVGFWSFLGLMALFSIPFIGWIACIVFMFAPKRKSMKNYARAAFTWMVLNLITSICILSLIITAIGNLVLPTINKELGTNFGSFEEIVDLGANVVTGDYSGVISTLEPQLTEALGEEYKPLLQELGNGDYNQMFNQIKNQQYDELIKDFEGGKYADLENVMGKEAFSNLAKEFKEAANGVPSEFLDEINNYLSLF